MYRTHPFKDIAYVFRALTDARPAKRSRKWDWNHVIAIGDKLALAEPVTLAEIKADRSLAKWSFCRHQQGVTKRRRDIREEGYWPALRRLLVHSNPTLAARLPK